LHKEVTIIIEFLNRFLWKNGKVYFFVDQVKQLAMKTHQVKAEAK
jgi:hypothetical protein